jgi:hypothetical protein
MSDNVQQAPNETPKKGPKDRVTGDEPMTGPHRSHLRTLVRRPAANLIEELQHSTGRGEAS